MKTSLRSAVWFFIFIFGPFPAFALNECDVPAFLNVSPPPNLLIGFDNSGSMYDLAYKKDGFFCYDNSYDNNNIYYGYYENDKIYTYASGQFQVASSMPSSGSCNNILGTNYFCIQKNDKIFYFRGNFLNWMTMSKLDLMKKALTGGKFESSTLIGESRGCVGRRFVKDVVGSGFSFGIVGSNLVGSGSEYQKIYSGGTTRIEIYEAPSGGFNLTPCMTAVDYIEEGNLGQGSKYTEDCLTLTANSSEGASFNHSMQSCWSLKTKSAFDPGDVSRLKNACENVYKSTTFPELTPSHGAYVCSKNIQDAAGNIIKGYVGNGYLGSKNAWDDARVYSELAEYCNMLDIPEVIDPSIYLQDAGIYGNMPSILIDSGFISQMGSPPLAVLNNIKNQTTTPVGILHDLKDRANIGLIAYNNYGSKYEIQSLANYFDPPLPEDRDGAKIFSPVQESNTHIINEFNGLDAYAWTPIAELFYEASRYFGGKNSAYGPEIYSSPINKTCQRNLLLFISDGGSTYDQNLPGSTFAGATTQVADPSLDVGAYLARIPEAVQSLEFGGTNYAKAVAYWAHETDHNTAMDKSQSIDFYTAFTLGDSTGNTLLQDIAKYGGYKEIDNVPGLTSGDVWDEKTNGLADNHTPDGVPDHYFQISDPDRLTRDLQLLLSEILEERGGAGAVATVTQQMGTGDIIVRGAFKTFDVNPKELSWKGHLESYWPYEGCLEISDETSCTAIPGCAWIPAASIKCTGNMYSFQHPDNSGKFCSDMSSNKNCWDAETMLPAPESRNIFTVLEGSKASGKSYLAKQEFVGTNTALCNDTNDWMGLTGDSLMGSSTLSVACTTLVNWVRGSEPSTGDLTWRNRGNWTLGDIVYSTPVVVEQPSLGSVAKRAVGNCGTECSGGCNESAPDSECAKECFYCYREVHKHRKKMIYVGANDGMLHAFVAGKWNNTDGKWIFDPAEDSEIGKESWAYIPSNLLPELKDLARRTYGTETCWHRFMVDLSPQARDAYIDIDGDGFKEWRTVILGGERQGGDVYFAIDVTDPDNPQVLWEYSVLRNMVQLEGSTATKTAVAPYLPLATYKKVSNFPASWSAPTVGRLTIPDGVEFWAWPKMYAPTESDPSSAPTPVAWRNTGTYKLSDWFAFIGGAVRLFDPVDDLPGGPGELTMDQRKATIKPYFMAIDLETGANIFQHLWPMLQTSPSEWAYRTDTSSSPDPNIIPYAMTAPVSLDIDQDGDVDHIYMGDLNGQFYSLRFNLSPSATMKGAKMDIWPTKTITPDDGSNIFRSDRQPIGATPALAFDRDPETRKYRLRAYFGTGKYDDVIGAKSDKSDTAKMSFYNLVVDNAPRMLVDLSADTDFDPVVAGFTGNSFDLNGDPLSKGLSAGNFVIHPNLVDAIPTTTDPADSTNTTYPHTILDFGIPGERVVDMALVAGKLLFFLTFVPISDDCASGGDAYLYILNYTGGSLTKDPLHGSGFVKKEGATQGSLGVGEYARTSDGKSFVAKVSNTGVPSQPVLDSSNQHVLIQTSDARIHKIKVELDQSPLNIKGWKEEETENP